MAKESARFPEGFAHGEGAKMFDTGRRQSECQRGSRRQTDESGAFSHSTPAYRPRWDEYVASAVWLVKCPRERAAHPN